MDLDPSLIGPSLAVVSTVSGVIGGFANKAIDYVSGASKARKDRIEKLETKLDSQAAQIESLVKAAAKKEITIANLRNEITQLKADQDDQQIRFEELESVLEQTNSHVEELKAQINSMGGTPVSPPARSKRERNSLGQFVKKEGE